MKIERVDEKTVKCFISNEELEEFDITYKDFITRSEKAKEIVEEIIEQAIEEVGYKPPQFAMDMQIMMLPEKGMVLTLSEKTPDDIKNNPALMEYLKEMRKTLEEHFGDIIETHGLPGQSGKDAGLQLSGESPKANSKKSSDSNEKNKQPDFAIFKMKSLRDLSDYARILPRNLRVESCLYADKGEYYLFLQKGHASYQRYSRACVQALEYGVLFGATEDKIVYLDEHAECLIPEKAVAKLRLQS